MLYLNLQTQLKIDHYINAIQRINNRRPKVSELEFKGDFQTDLSKNLTPTFLMVYDRTGPKEFKNLSFVDF